MPRKSIEPSHRHVLVLFPGALGDLLCCWPALQALRATAAGLTLVAGPAAAAALPPRRLALISIDRREIGDLFAAAPLVAATRTLLGGHQRVESFTGHGVPDFARRLAEASGGVAAVHPSRGMQPGEHATDYYARCFGIVARRPQLPIAPEAAAWAAAFWQRADLGERTLVVHPGSGSAGKNWQGMSAAATAWRNGGGRVLMLAGPAEAAADHAIAHDALLRDASLAQVAAALARAQRYLGNDSGISHLAGLVGARGVAVFGDSDPAIWHPHGAVQVVHAPQPCVRCGAGQLCTHRLPVDAVLAALAAA